MPDGYTPTVDEARADYARGFYENGGNSLLDGEAAFDRMIAAVEATARAGVLDWIDEKLGTASGTYARKHFGIERDRG